MKKILILLLCITLVMTSMVTSVFAVEETEAAESRDLLFMKSMGFFGEDIKEDTPITRLQLANIYLKIALGDEVSEETTLQVPFTDCKESDIAAAFVNSCGIMRGVGDGKFAPDSIITFNQLIKTAITFLGYENEAMVNGGYPSGYLIMATRLGIIKGGTSLGDSEITARKVASVFKLMQNATVKRRVVFGGDEEWINQNVNYLTLYMGIDRLRGVITAVHSTDIYDGKTFDYYDVIINDVKYEAADSMKGIIALLGHNVDVYVDTENELLGKILYYEQLQNNTIEISGRDIASVNGQSISYYLDNMDISQVAFSKNVFVIYNGTVCYSYSPQIINPFAGSNLDGGIKLLDNNGDMIFDYIFVDAFDTFVVSKNTNGKIFNKYRPSEVINLTGLENKDIEFTNINGEPINLTYAAEGDILSVSKDLNGIPKKIVLTVDTYSGTVKEITYKNGNAPESINISGNTFVCAKSIASSTELKHLKVGGRITMFFNKNGEVAEISASEDITYSTAYVIDAAKKNAGVSKGIEFRIFTPNGTFLIFPLASEIKTNNDTIVSDKAFYDSLSKDSSGRIDRFMFAYNLNDDEEIDEIILPDLTGKTGPFYRYKEFDGSFTMPSFKSLSFENRLLLNQNKTKIMVVPTDENRDNDDGYKIATTNGFFGDWTGHSSDRPNPQFEAYGSKPGNPTAETLLVKGDFNETIYNSNYVRMMIVDKITQITNEEGESVYKLYGFFNGANRSYVTDNVPDVLSEIKKILEAGDPKGDVVILGYDNNNLVYTLSWIFDHSKNKHTMPSNPNSAAWSTPDRTMYGRVIYADDYAFTVEVETAPGIFATESFPTANFSITECNFANSKYGVIAKKDKTRVLDAINYPGNESYVIVSTYNAMPKELIIFNK